MNACVRPAGTAKRAQDLVQPTRLVWAVETSALARTMPIATPSPAPASVCQVILAMIVKISVPRVFTDTIAPIYALARMEAIAQTRTDNANVPLDGQVYCANRPVGLVSTVKTARNNAIVKMELPVITSQANVRAALDSRMTHAMPPVRKAVSV